MTIRRRILLAELTPRIPLPQAFATWNPADKHADITLSGGNLVATKSTTHATNFAGVRSTVSQVVGQHYWETTVAYTGSGDFSVGLAQGGSALSIRPGEHWMIGQAYSVGIDKAGDVLFANVVQANIGAIASGAVIRHWLDLDARSYKVAVNGGAWVDLRVTSVDVGRPAVGEPLIPGSWAGDVEPLVPDECFSIASMLRPAGSTASVTANFGATAFAYPVPDGANAGMFTPASVETSVYVGSEGFDATIDAAPVHFMGRIAGNQDVEIEREGSCWVWGGQSLSRRGQLVVVNNDGALDAWRDYIWRDAPVLLRAGYDGDAYDDFVPWAYSRVDSIELTRDARIVLSFADPVAYLSKQLQADLYPAAQANLQLAGQPLPIVYGAPLYCTPPRLDTNPTVRDYQLHDKAVGDTALTEIAAVFDSGSLFNGPDDAFTPHDAITAANGGNFGSWSGPLGQPAGWSLPAGAGTFTANDQFGDAGSGFMRCVSKHAPLVQMVHGASNLLANHRYRITFTGGTVTTPGNLIFRVPGSPDVSVSMTASGAKSVALWVREAGDLRICMQGDGIDCYIRELRVSAEQVIDWTYWGTTRGFTLANAPYGKIVANPVNTLSDATQIAADIVARTALPNIWIDSVKFSGMDMTSFDDAGAETEVAVAAYIDKPTSGLDLLKQLANGWCGFITCNRLGQVRVGKIVAPSLATTGLLVLDESNVAGEVIVTSDVAKNLTLRLAGRKNNTVHDATDIASGVPQALATELQTPYLVTVTGAPASADPVSAAYLAAIAAPAQPTLLMDAIALQAEANRVATLWRPARNFYLLDAILGASTADELEPGQTVRMVWPRWGLAGGKNLLVVGIRSRFFSRRVQLKLWG